MDALSSARSSSFGVDTAGILDAACANALPPGTSLQGFEIVSPLGQGGFSIVYAAMDTALQRPVAVKEYMPTSFASRADSSQVILRSQRHKTSFDAGLNSFIEEARLLAQFKHPALVEVLSFWEENGTAYMAMPLYSGKTLRQTLRDHPRCANEVLLKRWIAPVLDVLELLHEQQVYHRDVAPDNIIIQTDGRPVLLDLGSARRVAADNDHAPTVVVKAGYAPIEQYAEDKSVPQGPWTDIYAMGALLYYGVTGRAPTASVSRMMKDSLALLGEQEVPGYSTHFLSGIDHALALQPADRPQSISELRDALDIHNLSASHAVTAVGLNASPVPEYEDEEKTVILSAEELDLLLRGDAKPGTPTSEDKYQNLFEAQPQPAPDTHAFADMEEFLSSPKPEALGRVSVPGSKPTKAADVSAKLDSAIREARSGRRLIWIAGLAGGSLIAALLMVAVLIGRGGEVPTSNPVVPDAIDVPMAERVLPIAPRVEVMERPAEPLLHDPPVLLVQEIQTSSDTVDDAVLVSAESDTILLPLPDIVTVRLDVETETSETVASPPAVLPTSQSAPAATQTPVNRRSQASPPPPRPTRQPPPAAATGKVELNILPWGEVWVDGTLRGVTPPLRTLDLPVGRRNIEIRNPGFANLTHNIEVSTEKTPHIVHEFISGSSNRNLSLPEKTEPARAVVQPRQRVAEQTRPAAKPAVTAVKAGASSYGYTDLRVRPWAEVWVNGEKKGVSPPLNELRLTEGAHTIEFRNPNYPSVKRTVNISSAQRSTLVQFFD